jgi:hypothetical protein
MKCDGGGVIRINEGNPSICRILIIAVDIIIELACGDDDAGSEQRKEERESHDDDDDDDDDDDELWQPALSPILRPMCSIRQLGSWKFDVRHFNMNAILFQNTN